MRLVALVLHPPDPPHNGEQPPHHLSAALAGTARVEAPARPQPAPRPPADSSPRDHLDDWPAIADAVRRLARRPAGGAA